MASQVPVQGGSATKQEYKIRVPRTNKKYGVMKFSAPKSVDFAQIKHVTLQRENNFNHFKQAHDLETMPKFGAGSEYGREQREEARRKKYGIVARRYSPHAQPWHLKVGTGKQGKKFKGTREGSVSEHSSYFVLQRGADGNFFDAYPVEEWHSFTPEVSFNYLNSEEAEDAFSRRAKIVNHHHIMVQKRLRDAEKDDDDDTGKGSDNEKEKSKQKRKSLMLTEMDDWVDSDDMEDDDEGADADAEDDEERTKSKAKKAKGKKSTKKKWKKEGRRNSDDEAIEDSDDGDEEGQEMDYDTDHSSSDNEVDVEEDKYNVKGVEDEEGLKKLNESGGSSSEQDSNKEDNEDDDDAPTNKKAESDMSSTSSEGGSDTETVPVKSSSSSSSVPKSSQNSEKSSASAIKDIQERDRKRKAANTPPVDSKRSRVDSPKTLPPPRSEELTEAAMRMYLQFKPMTAKELLKRFKHERQRLSKEELQEKFSMILRKIEPQQRTNSEGKRVFYLPQSQGS